MRGAAAEIATQIELPQADLLKNVTAATRCGPTR
jgi:hypothetical protein